MVGNWFIIFIEMGGSDMEGGMVYQDEDGNLIMYNHDEMGEDDDEMGDHDYGMEGSPGVSPYNWKINFNDDVGPGNQLRWEPCIPEHASSW